MRYFVISDVHSFYRPMKKALDEAGFDPENENHTLIVDGDLFDRGKNTVQVFKYIDGLPRKILIRGNHEDLLEEMVKRGEPWDMDEHNGTLQTLLNFNGKTIYQYYMEETEFPYKTEKTQKLVNWIGKNFVDYAEFSKYIIVHSWLPQRLVRPKKLGMPYYYVTDANWRSASEKEWRDSRWGNPFDCAKAMSVPRGKKIIAGHWHTSYAWHVTEGRSEFGNDAKFDIYVGRKLVMIDACTAHSKKCNVFAFDDNCPPKLGFTKEQRKKL